MPQRSNDRAPRLLIASSSEALPYAKALKKLLGPEIRAEVWDENLFEAGEYALESLERHGPEFDGALVIATGDDRVISRGKRSLAPRDNVILEFGLFVALFGRRRALLLVETSRSPKAPSDIAGLQYLPFKRIGSPKKSLKPIAKGLRRRAAHWRDAPLDDDRQRRVERILNLSMAEVARSSGISAGFGLHVFLLDHRTEPPRLTRVARERLGPRIPLPRSYDVDEGIVGTCVTREDRVFADFTQDALKVAGQAAWESLDQDSRLGMDWALLEVSRTRYKAVGALPITSFRPELGLVGCLAYNLGVDSTDKTDVLQDPDVTRALDLCAELLAVVLGH